MKTKMKTLFCLWMAVLLVVSLPAAALAAEGDASGQKGITLTYGEHTFSKVSNPTSGSGKADGINTNDTTGFGANRLNSYAWAVESRGDCIYIGTNRTLFGSAANALAENYGISPEKLGNALTLVSGGEVPVNLKEDDYIPQIIRVDTRTGQTCVIYRPNTVSVDGILYYTNKEGEVIKEADVTSEAASFRSVIQFRGNLYFGSLGANLLQLVRVDQNDNAEVVYEANGMYSSLRACCVYDAGDGETIYFGGQDTSLSPWRQLSAEDKKTIKPIVIRYLDPDTAGTVSEDWSNMVADFRDFGEYSKATVYANGGGNVWDLCSYNGRLYLILAYDGGWAMFRGEKGGANPNEYGWTWTEIVGNNSIYGQPLAMNKNIQQLYRLYPGFSGLLESTATPYVYNGKMYIGSFDNATAIQSQTIVKFLMKLQSLQDDDPSTNGPTLTQIYAPIYAVLSRPQHVWVMGEDEKLSAVSGANELLDGTTNDYVWRFIEHDGKLYCGTFDSSSAFSYFLDYDMERFAHLLESKGIKLPEKLKAVGDLIAMMDGKVLPRLQELMDQIDWSSLVGEENEIKWMLFQMSFNKLCQDMSDLMDGDLSQEAFHSDIAALKTVWAFGHLYLLQAIDTSEKIPDNQKKILVKGIDTMDALLTKVDADDVDGIWYWAQARALVRNAEKGFDLFVTENGQDWEAVVRDGFNDRFNYGARTFTVCNGELYVGTANPYYGAQLWKMPKAKTDDPTGGDPSGGQSGGDPSGGQSGGDPSGGQSGGDPSGGQSGGDPSGGQSGGDPSGGQSGGDPSGGQSGGDPSGGQSGGNPSGGQSGDDPSGGQPGDDPDQHKCPSAAFRDVDVTQWYHSSIDQVLQNGWMNGIDEKTFDPLGITNRAMIVTILYRFDGSPAPGFSNPFRDVPRGEWFRDAVIWASINGIVNGYGNATFGPADPITREQFAAILYRYSKFKGYDVSAGKNTGILSYKDASSVSKWALDAIRWACGAGLMQGDDQRNLRPGQNATRAESAALIVRFHEFINR